MKQHSIYMVNDTWLCRCEEVYHFNPYSKEVSYEDWLTWPVRHITNAILDKLPEVLRGHQITYTNAEDWVCECGDGCNLFEPMWDNWPITHVLDVVNDELRIT